MISQTYLIDTSAWVCVIRRPPLEAIERRVRELVATHANAANDVVRMELLIGARDRGEYDRIDRSILGGRWLAIGAATWARATELGYALRRAGATATVPDLLIAASAIEHDAVLLHADSDFDRIAEHSDLRVESYVDSAP